MQPALNVSPFLLMFMPANTVDLSAILLIAVLLFC